VAAPENTPPRPSPNHHTAIAQTMDSASAARHVLGQAIPNAMRNCVPAKSAFVSTGWWSTIDAFQVMVCAIQVGLPRAIPCNIPLNPFPPLLNMKG
jgi:hypothetical protein